MTPVLRLENITKTYDLNPVLRSVCLEVEAGEIHGLVGENGSGKTTLLNILTGSPAIRETGGYQGSIILNDQRLEIISPHQALGLGIGMVHQESALLPGLTIGQNIKLGRENLMPSTRFLGNNLSLIDNARDEAQARAIMGRLGLDVNMGLKSGGLPINIRHLVELAREFSRQDLRVLVLDEPTTYLGTEDARCFRQVLQEIAGNGTAIIFVSHRLEEVLEVCHSVTVLRDGKVTANLKRDDPGFTLDGITLAMVGQAAVKVGRRSAPARGPMMMRFEDFTVDMPGEAIKCLNLEVYQGEILGLAGLSGHGKLALGNGVSGLFPAAGRVKLQDSYIDVGSETSVTRAGVCFLHDDRRRVGLLWERSVMENILFAATQQKNRFLKRNFLKFPHGPLSLVDWKVGAEYTRRCIKRFDIKCQSINQPVKFLSGGNQQKVCLARVVALEPKVLFIAEPTRGIDVGAKQAVLDALRDINQETGTTIVCASSELGDLKQLCHRIVVMHEGEVAGQYPPETSDAEFTRAFSGRRTEN